MSKLIPTIRVEHVDAGPCVINECDFDEKIHALIEDKDPPKGKKDPPKDKK